MGAWAGNLQRPRGMRDRAAPYTWPLCALLAALAGCAHSSAGPAAGPRHTATAEAPPAAPAAPPSCEIGTARNALPAVSHAELLRTLGSGLDAYRVTGGVWLADQPLLLNEPFDFAVAMAMPDIGPAIAAGKRLSANQQKADALAGMALAEPLLARLAALRACGVHAFAVLWGPERDELQVAVDVFQLEASSAPVRIGHCAAVRSLAGPLPADAEAAGRALEAPFVAALAEALASLAAEAAPTPALQVTPSPPATP